MSYYIKRGNTWDPTLTVTDNGVAMDCTGYAAKMWIKETLRETAPEIHVLDITWTDQSIGEGLFTLTHAQSSNLLGRYWIEVILYHEADNSVVTTLIQDKLYVRETLEKDL